MSVTPCVGKAAVKLRDSVEPYAQPGAIGAVYMALLVETDLLSVRPLVPSVRWHRSPVYGLLQKEVLKVILTVILVRFMLVGSRRSHESHSKTVLLLDPPREQPIL